MKKETMEQMDVFSRHINGGKGPLAEALAGVARMQKAAQKEESAGTKEYILMNKDVEVAEFRVNEWGIVENVRLLKELPNWISNFRAFIEGRRAPKHRENIAQLLQESGCATLQGYLDITHALSLIDTYWVKPIGSLLKWKDVSLYIHEFNEVIAKTAFEGGLHGRNLSTTSPEYGTDGSFAKCWVREDGQIRMLKRGSSGARNAGLEPYSEYYAAQVAEYFHVPYVKYDLRSRSGRVHSVCDIFTSEEYGYLPYTAIGDFQSDVFSVLEKCAEYGFESRARAMFVFDAVIMNEDRHKGNFGFLIENDTQKIVDFAPLFDHNISLLPYAEEDDFHRMEKYMLSHGPRLADTFLQSAKICITPELEKVLINLRGFEFIRHPKYNLPEWRLKALEEQMQQNIERILG